MKVEQVVWERNDTFGTMHKKLLALKGKQVQNNMNPLLPLTIFSVGRIKKAKMRGLCFGEKKKANTWEFEVEFVALCNGDTILGTHYFHALRTDNKEIDMKQVIIEEKHPFITYNLSK